MTTPKRKDADFQEGDEVVVETNYFGECRAKVVGYYPAADPPYINLWLLSGYPGAFYTPDSIDKVKKPTNAN